MVLGLYNGSLRRRLVTARPRASSV